MIHFFTNLDEMQPYVDAINRHSSDSFSYNTTTVPQIGSSVEFKIRADWVQRMQVIDVTHSSDGRDAKVELHLGKHWRGTLLEWMELFRDRKYR